MSDISIKWGYVDVDDGTGTVTTEPAMGLRPAKLGRPPIFAIPLSSAYLYADAEYLLKRAFQIAEFFGMFPDQFLVNRIADTILSYLPELIRMKPAPADEVGRENGEGKLRVAGDVVSHFAMTTTGGVLR